MDACKFISYPQIYAHISNYNLNKILSKTNLYKIEQQPNCQLERLCKCLNLTLTKDKENIEPIMLESFIFRSYNVHNLNLPPIKIAFLLIFWESFGFFYCGV